MNFIGYWNICNGSRSRVTISEDVKCWENAVGLQLSEASWMSFVQGKCFGDFAWSESLKFDYRIYHAQVTLVSVEGSPCRYDFQVYKAFWQNAQCSFPFWLLYPRSLLPSLWDPPPFWVPSQTVLALWWSLCLDRHTSSVSWQIRVILSSSIHKFSWDRISQSLRSATPQQNSAPRHYHFTALPW